jgi:hypothetical protein
MRNDYPTAWRRKCPHCGDRIKIELPIGTEEGRTGTAKCRRGYELLFGYDRVTVRLLEAVGEER